MNASVISSARFSPKPGFIHVQRFRGRRRLGVKYEHRVQDLLHDKYGEAHLPSPWITYKLLGDNRDHFAQPDALIRLDDRIIIVEAKYSHTPKAWFQLFEKYEPLVRHLFPAIPTACIEICKWYDPAVMCPQSPSLCSDITLASFKHFNVHIYRP